MKVFPWGTSARARALVLVGVVGLAAILQAAPVRALNEPQLISTSPQDGATVSALASVRASYDRDVKGAPASSFAITDVTGTTVAGTISRETPSSLQFTPEGSFTEAASPYRATVTARPEADGDPTTTVFSFAIDATNPPTPTITSPTNAQLTNADPVHVIGAAEAGAVIRIEEEGAPIATGSANPSGAYDVALSLGAEDGVTHSLRVLAIDAAGNQSTPATVSFTHDNVAPAVPTIDTPDRDIVTSNRSVTLGGTSAPNGSVVVFDGTAQAATVAAPSGSWSVTLSDLAERAHPFTVRARDAAGNTSPASAARTVTIDVTAPVVPTVQVSPARLNQANQTDVAVSGTAEPASTIALQIDDQNAATTPVTASMVAAENGSYAFADLDLSGLEDGQLAVMVRSTDAAANASTTSVSLPKDTVAPAAPGVAFELDIVNAAGQTQVRILGTGETASTATITITGTGATPSVEKRVTVVDGAFSTLADVSALADGELTARATLTDQAGNTSPASQDTTHKDTVAPGAPVITSPANGAVRTVRTFTVTGTAEPRAAVRLSEAGAALASTTAAEDGSWSTEVTVAADGDRRIESRQTDVAGNQGSSSTVEVIVDTEAPTLASSTPADGGSVQSTPTVTARYSEKIAGGTIELVNRVGTIVAGSTSVDDRSLVFTPSGSLTESGSPFVVSARAADRAGRDSGPSTFTFGIDVTAPGTPLIDRPADGAAVRGGPLFEGRAEPKSTVRLIDGGVDEIAAIAVDDLGRWAARVYLPDGAHAITARAVDRAGNQSAPSQAVRLTIDTMPTIASPRQSAITGPSVEIAGTAPAGWSVKIAEGARNLMNVQVTNSGTWSTTLPFSSGTHTIEVTGRSPSGFTSRASEARTFVVDASRPQIAFTTEENTIFRPGDAFTVEGTASDDYGVGTVRLEYFNILGGKVASVDAALEPAGGTQVTWSATARGLLPGRYTLQAKAFDVNGSASTTVARTFIVTIV